jgi:hypothetical protein
MGPAWHCLADELRTKKEAAVVTYAGDVETLLLAGLVALLLVLAIGTGVVLLLFVWLRQLWRELRRTPSFSRMASRAAVARPMLTYRDVLRRAPPAALELTSRLQRKALALESIRDQLGSEQRFRVAETTRRYLPDTMNAFRLALAGADDGRQGEASALLVKQLSDLEAGLDGIAAGAGEKGLLALRANGVFLDQLTSGNSQPGSQAAGNGKGLG